MTASPRHKNIPRAASPRYTGLTDFRVTLRGPGRKFSIRRTQLRPKGKFFLPSGERVMADMMMQEAELALVS